MITLALSLPVCFQRLLRSVLDGCAGISADANILINYARTASQRHFYVYQVPEFSHVDIYVHDSAIAGAHSR